MFGLSALQLEPQPYFSRDLPEFLHELDPLRLLSVAPSANGLPSTTEVTEEANRSRWSWLGTPRTTRGRIASVFGLAIVWSAAYFPTIVFDLGIGIFYAIFVPLCIPMAVVVDRIDKRAAQTALGKRPRGE